MICIAVKFLKTVQWDSQEYSIKLSTNSKIDLKKTYKRKNIYDIVRLNNW